MRYVNVIANVIVWSLITVQSALGQGTDYTTRNFPTHSCELFAMDAYQAADTYKRGVDLHDVLEVIDGTPVAKSKKNRAFQAIQFVWKNQLDNPTLAYSLAMGLCLKPKKEMAPMDEPWVTSLRTSKEYF